MVPSAANVENYCKIVREKYFLRSLIKISQETIDAVTNTVDIVGVISEYTKLEHRGNDFWGCCPFHGEKTPSFYINTSKQIYKCFGCGEGGDVINFVMRIENLDFMDAVKLLASRCGIEINTNVDESTKEKIEKSLKNKRKFLHFRQNCYIINC